MWRSVSVPVWQLKRCCFVRSLHRRNGLGTVRLRALHVDTNFRNQPSPRWGPPRSPEAARSTIIALFLRARAKKSYFLPSLCRVRDSAEQGVFGHSEGSWAQLTSFPLRRAAVSSGIEACNLATPPDFVTCTGRFVLCAARPGHRESGPVTWHRPPFRSVHRALDPVLNNPDRRPVIGCGYGDSARKKDGLEIQTEVRSGNESGHESGQIAAGVRSLNRRNCRNIGRFRKLTTRKADGRKQFFWPVRAENARFWYCAPPLGGRGGPKRGGGLDLLWKCQGHVISWEIKRFFCVADRREGTVSGPPQQSRDRFGTDGKQPRQRSGSDRNADSERCGDRRDRPVPSGSADGIIISRRPFLECRVTSHHTSLCRRAGNDPLHGHCD